MRPASSRCNPNQEVVKVIHSFNDFSFIHAMSDVTGFGLAGHTKEILQNSSLSAVIDKVPSIRLSRELSNDLGYAFEECECHETAGGMLLSVDPNKTEEFSNTLQSNNIQHWIIGKIESKKYNQVNISQDVEYLEISDFQRIRPHIK